MKDAFDSLNLAPYSRVSFTACFVFDALDCHLDCSLHLSTSNIMQCSLHSKSSHIYAIKSHRTWLRPEDCTIPSENSSALESYVYSLIFWNCMFDLKEQEDEGVLNQIPSDTADKEASDEKRALELQYQQTFYRLRKTLLNRVDEFQSSLISKGAELLPQDYWSVAPQVFLPILS